MRKFLLCLACVMKLSCAVFAAEPISVKVQKVALAREGLLWKKLFIVGEFEVKNVSLHPIYIATQQNPETRLYISSSILHVDCSPMRCRDMSMEEPFWTLFERIMPGQLKYLKFRKRLRKETSLPKSVKYSFIYYDSESISKSECTNNKGNDTVLINCFCLGKMPKYNAFTGISLIW